MALGFRDCCNEFNYFLLRDTPGTVSEFEVYLIETAEGPTFCGTYINLPPLNYTPTTYNVVNLAQQSNCSTCIAINPCPIEENILENQFGPGSVITQPDCNFTSIRYLLVDCFPVNPTYENSLDGEVILNVNGGVPPYVFRDFYTNQVLQGNPVIDNFYRVLNGVPAGDYRFLVSDTDENFILDVTCTLTAPPPFPVFGAEIIDATVFGKPDGQINLIVLSAGTPPYSYVINGVVYDELPIIIGAGTYTIIIYDEYYTTQLEVTVGEPPPVDYPSQLCFNALITTAPGCSQIFGITFERFVNYYDYRAQYFALNPEIIGFSILNLRYEESMGGWVILPEFWGGNPQFSFQCPVAIIAFGDVGFKKLDGTTDTPDGDWSSTAPLNFSNVVVTAGVCSPSLTLRSTTDVCKDNPITLGSVTLEAIGGTGPPYKYVVVPPSGTPGGGISSPSPVINNLSEGTYTAYVLDNQGNQSDTITFTINSIAPYTLNLSTIPQCVTSTSSSVFLNVIPGTPTNQINPGEVRRTRITTTTNFNFNYLPPGFEIQTRITIAVTFTSTVSVTPYTDPRIYITANTFNGNSAIITSNITTDGVTSNFFEGVNSTFSPSASFNLGDGWYRVALGTTSCATGTGNCPLPLDVNGVRYQKVVNWTSNILTINNTTSISLTYFNDYYNGVPIIQSTRVLPGGGTCYNGCGGGQLDVNLVARLLTPTKIKGCGRAINPRNIISYTYRQHPNNGANFVNLIPPSPACP